MNQISTDLQQKNPFTNAQEPSFIRADIIERILGEFPKGRSNKVFRVVTSEMLIRQWAEGNIYFLLIDVSIYCRA